MRIDLKAHSVNRAQAAKIAVLDALTWLWFHQVCYTSIFTETYLEPQAVTLSGVVVNLALVIGIVRARWDRVPRAIRAITAVGATLALFGFIVLPVSAEGPGLLETVLSLAMAAFSGLAAILRLETLAKCDDFSTLSVALSGSVMLFYLMDLVLLIVPREVYSTLVAAAPLVLLVGLDTPTPATARSGPLPKKVRLSLPVIVPCILGACAGFVVSLGTVSAAFVPQELFTHPSPLFLVSQLLFLLLSIVTACGLDLKKASYFAAVNLCWGIGTAAGGIAQTSFLATAQPLVSDISSFICLMTIVMFFSFSGIWINSLGKTVVTSRSESVLSIAQEAGLTKRETEVVTLLLEGRSLRIIQDELFISEGTARTHTKRIYAKLGVHSKQELIDYFKEHIGR